MGMKGGTVQIAWHGSEPILSLDFHSISGLLATAGADHDIKVFYPCVPPLPSENVAKAARGGGRVCIY